VDSDPYRQYLDPRLLGAVSKLEFRTRKIVEGTRLGRHRSPMHGISVEFAEHREYSPGDDPRHLDWKVFAKRDRFFVKQYEEETNLAGTLLLDVSDSMQYRGAGSGLSKLDYAKYLSAALSWLLIEQQDAAGLVTFDSAAVDKLPPKASGPHFRAICAVLEKARGGPRTDLGAALHRAAGEIDRRGLVVVLSDFVDEPDRILAGLQHLAFRGHELLAVHVVDGDEREFPFRGSVAFEDLEGDARFTCDARDLRAAYLAAFEAHCSRLRTGCRSMRLDYLLADTREPLDVTLTAYLNGRARRPR
jgi:uncharacterized protein (DUF58 family)